MQIPRIVSLLPLLAIFAAAPGARAEDPGTGVSLMIGVPHPVNLEVSRTLGPNWSVGLAGGYIPPISFSAGEYSVGLDNFDARVRWHPWGGSFFLGLIAGDQIVPGAANQSIDVSGTAVPVHIDLTIRSLYLTPHFGWFHVAKSGFNIGFELGVQVPAHSSSTLAVSVTDPSLSALSAAVQATRAYQNLESDITTAANRLGQKALPYVTLLRLGWFF